MKILNAFSLQMVDLPFSGEADEITKEQVRELLKKAKVESAVGHEQTAKILTNELGIGVAFNRVNIHLDHGEVAVIAQITGGRLPEGATTLPEGFGMKYVLLQVK